MPNPLTNREMIQKARTFLNPRTLSRDNTAGGVACALLSAGGNLYFGVCIDINSGIGFCAEHSAIAALITAGESRIAKIVAVCGENTVLPPCGRCREFMAAVDAGNLATTQVVLGEERTLLLKELLPYPYAGV